MLLGLFREMTCDDVSDVLKKDTSQIRTSGLDLLLSKSEPQSSRLLQPNDIQLSTQSIVHVCIYFHVSGCVGSSVFIRWSPGVTYTCSVHQSSARGNCLVLLKLASGMNPSLHQHI